MHLFFFNLKGIDFLFNSQPCFFLKQLTRGDESKPRRPSKHCEKNRGWDSSAHRQLSKCSAAQMRWAASYDRKMRWSQEISTAGTRLFGQSSEFNGFAFFVDGNPCWSINVVLCGLSPCLHGQHLLCSEVSNIVSRFLSMIVLPQNWTWQLKMMHFWARILDPNLMILVLLCFNGIQCLLQKQNRRTSKEFILWPGISRAFSSALPSLYVRMCAKWILTHWWTQRRLSSTRNKPLKITI